MQIIAILFIFIIVKILQYITSITLSNLFSTEWGVTIAIGACVSAVFLFMCTEIKARYKKSTKLIGIMTYAYFGIIAVLSFLNPLIFGSTFTGLLLFGFFGQEAEFIQLLVRHNPNYRYLYVLTSLIPVGLFSIFPVQGDDGARIIYILGIIFTYLASHYLSHTNRDEKLANFGDKSQMRVNLIVGSFFTLGSLVAYFLASSTPASQFDDPIGRLYIGGLSIAFYLLGSMMIFSAISVVLIQTINNTTPMEADIPDQLIDK